MKTAVVYYSLDGSTRTAAELIAQRLGAQIFELEEIKKRSGKPFYFMMAGFDALTGRRSRLKHNPAEEMNEYGVICVGSPLWATRTVPAVNAFLCELKAAGKQIVLFTLQADPNPAPSKGLQKLIRRLEERGARVNRVIRLHGAKPGQTAALPHIERQLDKIL